MRRHDLVASLERFFADTAHPVVCAYLYGSRARDTARDSSDIDVAVLLSRPREGLLDAFGRLHADLERRLGREVDLVDLGRAPVDLVHRVLRDGVLLADNEPSERIRFEVRARNEYFDLLPHLKRYRRGRAA